jgi:hypothetical protein
MMYVDPEIAIAGGAQVLTLLNRVLALAETAREKGKANGLGIADIIEKLPAEAFSLAGQFERQVNDLRHSFLVYGIDTKKTIDELQSETWFYQWGRKKLLDNFKPMTDAIVIQLTTLLDDAVAIARCSGEENLLAVSYSRSRERKTQLRRSLDQNLPVGELLDALLKEAATMRAALGDLLK